MSGLLSPTPPQNKPLKIEPPGNEPDINLFFQAAGKDRKLAAAALEAITANWRNAYAGMVLDLARFMSRVTSTHPSAKIRKRLIRFLKKQTGKRFGDNLSLWKQWLWSLPDSPHRDIFFFKAKLYSIVDPGMAHFFKPGMKSTIRLDEVDWGGVKINGIPPLDHPPVLKADEANYLDDRDVVFGLNINGDARAYPKRITAWHEMVLDRLGGKDITLVYCTLCGAAIPYNSQWKGSKYRFGTSGLLYRSNKLMFDHQTRSLWSALGGEPVIGPLVGRGVRLETFPLVTTTWGEWKRDHPGTTVLSRQTGFKRDYSEGAAYKDYFATHRLMFPVSTTDKRLKNKAGVLVMVLQDKGGTGKKFPLAISSAFLRKRRLYELEAAGVNLLVITSSAGAHRVYHAGNVKFKTLDGSRRVIDEKGRKWEIAEPYLQLQQSPAARLMRIPAHMAFWFGWYAQYPDTRLIKSD